MEDLVREKINQLYSEYGKKKEELNKWTKRFNLDNIQDIVKEIAIIEAKIEVLEDITDEFEA